jgi:transposase
VPALNPYLIEPIWEQFRVLLPERKTNHPLGCHRPRIPDKLVFEKLVEVLVFGCAYWRVANEGCSATTLRRRRDEWIEEGVMDRLREMVLEAYDRFIGLLLGDANAYLTDPNYNTLRLRLENAHAAVEAAMVEARRRVRLNGGR